LRQAGGVACRSNGVADTRAPLAHTGGSVAESTADCYRL
jgi:hypothetical protein